LLLVAIFFHGLIFVFLFFVFNFFNLLRILAIFRLLCTYFLLSTTTALLVRLWIVSLPAFMYLMLACIARFTPAPPDPP
jgi:hypothetical protein